ncbi:MAG TPA: efflux RND transporter periplasmic adaptor subunit, partial [Gemmataceae bacterium]|nr:efflux RND transporter periplasmic adaptor subunit [Gemmataceae bacterium]
MTARTDASRPRGSVCFLLFGGVVLIPVLAGGCSPPAARTPEAPKVTVAHPIARDVTEYEEFNGTLQADKSVDVRSRVRGYIVSVNFENGQIVNGPFWGRPGDVLFVLDPRDFDAAIGRAEDRVKVAEAQFNAAEAEARRERFLASGNASSQATLEKAFADAAALAAQVSAAKNELTRVKLEKEYSEIKAEIGGRIGAANLTVGDLVNAGGSDPLLATIVGIDPIRVVFNVDERSLYLFAKNLGVETSGLDDLLAKLREMKPRPTIEFRLNGEKEFSRTAQLVFADNRIDPYTGT